MFAFRGNETVISFKNLSHRSLGVSAPLFYTDFNHKQQQANIPLKLLFFKKFESCTRAIKSILSASLVFGFSYLTLISRVNDQLRFNVILTKQVFCMVLDEYVMSIGRSI